MNGGTKVAPVADALGSAADPLDPAELFHESSKLHRHREALLRTAKRDRTLARLIDQGLANAAGRGALGRSSPVRSWRNTARTALPLGVRSETAAGLARLVRRRRSTRRFSPLEIELAQLAEALRLTYGFSAGSVSEQTLLRRPIPSPGALFSLELYVAALRVTSLPRGIHVYDVASHELCLLRGTEAADRFEDVLTSLGGVTGCAAYVILTTVIERLRWKYGPRAYRLALLEAGHAGQQLCLTAAALDLAACPIQAFLDDELADLLGVDGISELPIHLVGVGRPEDDDRPRPRPEAMATFPDGPVALPVLRAALPGAPGAPPERWEHVDAEMTAAFQDLAVGRRGAARRRLIALEARLGAADATIRDYLDLSTRRPAPRLLAGDGVLLHLGAALPGLGPSGEAATTLLRTLEEDRREMMRRLGFAHAPAAFVEIDARTSRPITLIGGRLVHHKICLPPGCDAETLRHELVHAICAPPNLVVAEGLACLAASGAGAIREAERDLEPDAPDRLLMLFRGRTPGTTGGEALRDEDAWLVYPLAGSFLLFLCDRIGRRAVDHYASGLVAAGTDATADEQERLFEAAFGWDLRRAAAEWKRALVQVETHS